MKKNKNYVLKTIVIFLHTFFPKARSSSILKAFSASAESDVTLLYIITKGLLKLLEKYSSF